MKSRRETLTWVFLTDFGLDVWECVKLFLVTFTSQIITILLYVIIIYISRNFLDFVLLLD
jgi:hypothetical protein